MEVNHRREPGANDEALLQVARMPVAPRESGKSTVETTAALLIPGPSAVEPDGGPATIPDGVVSMMPGAGPNIVADLVASADLPEPDADERPTSISPCPGYVRWNIELLAKLAETTQERVLAHCIAGGTRILYSFPGIEQVRLAREHVLECCADSEYMAWFSRCLIDIPTLDTGSGKFSARIPKPIRSQYARLADMLGLRMGQVAVLATMAVLIDGDFVSARYKVAMRDALIAFRKKVERRAELALVIQARTTPAPSVNITLQDVFDAD